MEANKGFKPLVRLPMIDSPVKAPCLKNRIISESMKESIHFRKKQIGKNR